MSIIKSTSYNIHIGNGCFDALNAFLKKSKCSGYFIICDENSFSHCLPTLLFHVPLLNDAEIIELESGEDKKTLETCLQVWGALTDTGADKKSLIINLGGGVISDLGGFVASTFKRGIDFINIPTTLLSMVDASVGGKTGVDFEGIKNHIGTTYEPKGIFVNPGFLETLSERQIRNGYAEIIKIALIADFMFWKKLTKLKSAAEFSSELVIKRAIELKNDIVKKDLRERNIRKSLNFGHSIGHALESALLEQKKDILHGEAIAAGMLMEGAIGLSLQTISSKEFKMLSNYINSIYTKIKISKDTEKLLMNYIIHDKKNEGSELCFALPKGIGTFELVCGIEPLLVKKTLENYQQL
ncbi:MAG: 3-dehydroquinate synthase [Bacteroidota bacterium]|jgi:3-dehydroquinate synthase|nr:3-dehydroquinate synthase [Bacteroidota bacterium]